MTQGHLARRWNVSKQAVAAMVQRGMPMDSIEAAEAWRAARPRSAKAKGKAECIDNVTKSGTDKPASPEEQAAAVEGKGWRGLDAVERLERHREQLEARLDFANAEARRWKDLDPELSRKWLALASQLAARAPALESKLADGLERAKMTITTQRAQAIFCAFFAMIRGALEAAPAGLAGKVNPADESHSLEVLTHWRDSLFRRLNAAPVVTP